MTCVSGLKSLRCLFVSCFLATNCAFCWAQSEQNAAVPTFFPPETSASSIIPRDFKELKEPKMRWAPKDFAKDPTVVRFNGKYMMYFSIPPQEKDGGKYGWTTGIAQSDDLTNWEYVKNLLPQRDYEKKGFCAPCARVFDGKVFLFYQSYGNGAKDAICMAVSDNGLDFEPCGENPIFRPHGDWTNGRAIDADVYYYKGRFFLYAATRDPKGAIQKIVVATSGECEKSAEALMNCKWTQAFDGSILEPKLSWETRCIEAPTTIEHNGLLYMFYAGGYNNDPQHVGVAISSDGVQWERLWNVPFMTNGPQGQWNSSESGHPGVFCDEDGQTWLFYQGNDTKGKSWFLSRVKIGWRSTDKGVDVPFIIEEER